MLKVTIRKRQDKCRLFGSEKKITVQPWFVKLHLNNPQDFWNKILWTEKIKMEMFVFNAQNHIWRKSDKAYQHKHLNSSLKHGGRLAMIWACFAVKGLVHLAVTESTINSSRVRCEAICPTARSWPKLDYATGQ